MIRWLLSFVGHVKGKVLLAVGLGIISNLSVVAIPLIGLREVLKMLEGDQMNPGQALLLMVVCGVVRGISRYGEQYLNHDIAFRLLATIREQIFATIRRLGPAKLTGKRSGDLVTAITTDVEALEVFFAHTISPVLIACGTTLITVGFLGSYSVFLAIILLFGQLLVGVVIPVFGYRKSRILGDSYQEAFVHLNQNVMEDVLSLQDIGQYSLEDGRIQKLEVAGSQLNKQYKGRLAQESSLKSWSEAILLTTAVCIFSAGIYLNLPTAAVLIGTILSLSSFGPVLALSGLGSALLTTLASGRRLYTLTQETPAVEFSVQGKQADDFKDAALKNVSFSYGAEQKKVLTDLTLEIDKGVIIGIGGESGNGKSTLLKLLMRYWDPQTGQILLNQSELKEFQEASLHQIEGVMEQSTFIFEDTIINNIGIGKQDASLQEIEIAAKKAALHEWIVSLSEKYETKIGGNHRSVSDGERQRIGLARLFLHDAPLLLLDEPTSNLDYLNEQAVLASLVKGINGKTVLLISHRDTTLEIADQRYELFNGSLLQRKSKQ
ncbi:hypothetical protein RV18_GL003288 [Enterococcus termitis]|nr:hypothetical protein RV18_GL003288 [Enterococcus termitis]